MEFGKPDDIVTVTFWIMQNGNPVGKEVQMRRQTFIEYNAKPKEQWSELYDLIVRDKAYIRIIDLTNAN